MFRTRKNNDSTRVFLKTAKRDGGKVDHYIEAFEDILSTIPSSYITSPRLTSYLYGRGGLFYSDRLISGASLELWFRTEEDRKNGIEILRNNEHLSYLIGFVHSEVGKPEEVIPQHVGFTAGCMWIENHPRRGVSIFGIPDAPKDNKRKLLNITNASEPLDAFMRYMRFRNECMWNGSFQPYSLSEASARKIADAVRESSFGTSVTKKEMNVITDGSSSCSREVRTNSLDRAYAQFEKLIDYIPEGLHRAMFANLVKHNTTIGKIVKSNFDVLERPFRRSVAEICEMLEARGVTVSPKNIELIIVEMFVTSPNERGRTRDISSLIVADILCTMLREIGDDAQQVLDFVETVVNLPNNDLSMWSIYTSWKNGCEHWELGPVLAASFIERIPAGYPPHEKCNRDAPRNSWKISREETDKEMSDSVT